MRKRLPADGYAYLALLALRHHGELTKGTLAWEIRANHPMVTKVLRLLREAGLVEVRPRGDGAFAIRAGPGLAEHLARHGPTLQRLFAAAIADHLRYGRRPAWAASHLAQVGG